MRVSWSIWAINTDIITQRVNKMLIPITFLSFLNMTCLVKSQWETRVWKTGEILEGGGLLACNIGLASCYAEVVF